MRLNNTHFISILNCCVNDEKKTVLVYKYRTIKVSYYTFIV